MAFVLIQTIGWAVEGGLSFSSESLFALISFAGVWSSQAAIFSMWYLALEPTVRRPGHGGWSPRGASWTAASATRSSAATCSSGWPRAPSSPSSPGY